MRVSSTRFKIIWTIWIISNYETFIIIINSFNNVSIAKKIIILDKRYKIVICRDLLLIKLIEKQGQRRLRGEKTPHILKISKKVNYLRVYMRIIVFALAIHMF